MARYGIPYRGSKSRIAEWVVENLPPADTLVDLFAGGCAVTHAAVLSGKFEHFIVNDISDAPKLFIDAVNGVGLPVRTTLLQNKPIADSANSLLDYQSERHCSKTTVPPCVECAPLDYQSERHCSKTKYW